MSDEWQGYPSELEMLRAKDAHQTQLISYLEGQLAASDQALRSRRIIDGLREALDAKFDDGTSVVGYIFATNPELKQRLRVALGLNKGD